jgi:hypothetical protein
MSKVFIIALPEEVNYVKNREHTRSPKVYQYDPKTL